MNRLLLLALALTLAPQLPAAPQDPEAAADPATTDDGIAPPPRGSIWRQTGPDGKPVFTDRPPPGAAEQVPLPPLNQVPAFRNNDDGSGTPASRTTPFPGYQPLLISGVEPGTTLVHPQEPVSILVKVVPGLQPGHQLLILHNGTQANTNNSSSVTIAVIPRGEHTFTAEIRDANGQVVATGEPLTFSVTRPVARNRP
jgi:hypothetical protein